MKTDVRRFEAVLRELIDENALACQGIMSILTVEYTDAVSTLAVSLEAKPSLLVNLDFLNAHATKEVHLKTVLLHEFLHVLLNHTEQFESMDAATNLALDAIINHIIHRSHGAEYSDFFSRYYGDQQGHLRLLRPLEAEVPAGDSLYPLRRKLMEGKIVVDDLRELVHEMSRDQYPTGSPLFKPTGGKCLLGNHATRTSEQAMSEQVREALRETLKSLNGHGIYREPKSHGFGADPYPERFAGKGANMRRWEHEAWRILRKLCTADSRASLTETADCDVLLPVLNESDRRAFVTSMWSPLLPNVCWSLSQEQPGRTTAVYLDVSGSMQAEMQSLVHLLWRLKRFIREPLWAFSDQVSQATIRKGILETETSGGTAMNSVLAHFAASTVEQAVVVTDGYIEPCDADLLHSLGERNIYAVVSRDGSTHVLDRAGIPSYQLENYPAG